MHPHQHFLPQQEFTASTIALVSGTSYNLTLTPLYNSSTTRLWTDQWGYLQSPHALNSTRVRITGINSNVVTVNSMPAPEENPEHDANFTVDLTQFVNGVIYFSRNKPYPNQGNYWGF